MSTWRIKVDEDLSEDVTAAFRDVGHDATSVFLQDWLGTKDHELWPRIVAEARWLVTADKGFADVRRLQDAGAVGIVLFRLQHESREGYLSLARLLMTSIDLGAMEPAIVVVTESGIRVHRR